MTQIREDWSARISSVQLYRLHTASGDEFAGVDIRIEHGGVVWLTNLWVAEDKRRMGVATSLMKKAITDWGHRDIYLRVNPYSDRPRSFDELADWYRAWGFTMTDVPAIMRREGIVIGR